MPVFLTFAIAASMCVLCFAVGFVAALALRITRQTATWPAAAPEPLETATAPEPAIVPASPAATPAPVPAVPSISLPHVEQAEQPQRAPESWPATPSPQHAAHPARTAGFPAPLPAPPAKVFLFGDPHVEGEVVPSITPMYAAAAPNPRTAKQHASPQRFTPAEVDLLPRRPQHARGPGRR
jgi:hypothetical protein